MQAAQGGERELASQGARSHPAFLAEAVVNDYQRGSRSGASRPAPRLTRTQSLWLAPQQVEKELQRLKEGVLQELPRRELEERLQRLAGKLQKAAPPGEWPGGRTERVGGDPRVAAEFSARCRGTAVPWSAPVLFVALAALLLTPQE